MPQISEPSPIPFVYFGSSRLSVIVLDELLRLGYKPSLIVTTPDKPQGRKLILTANVVKTWAIEHGIPVLDPIKLDDVFLANLKLVTCNLFIVASYGKIIPDKIIELPTHKTLNIHPSLLPQYRGASPLPTAILEDTKKTGVSIMQLDAEMDHGPVIAQKKIDITEHFKDWPTYEDFEEFMAKQGAQLLAESMPAWVAGKITPQEQDHSKATYTKKLTKEDGLIDFSIGELKNLAQIPFDRAYTIFRKIQAFHEWPQAYFFIEKDGAKLRIKITEAVFEGETLMINKVIPEGKKEISYSDFVRNYLK
ncbi:MAG TPA: methionyl-tRNA formyltransferase [Candidatus Paceibacterota bacterium]|nr:methionyl-tRNA formyltransferase [Candidatus Paceibacterota bacterium]